MLDAGSFWTASFLFAVYLVVLATGGWALLLEWLLCGSSDPLTDEERERWMGTGNNRNNNKSATTVIQMQPLGTPPPTYELVDPCPTPIVTELEPMSTTVSGLDDEADPKILHDEEIVV